MRAISENAFVIDTRVAKPDGVAKLELAAFGTQDIDPYRTGIPEGLTRIHDHVGRFRNATVDFVSLGQADRSTEHTVFAECHHELPAPVYINGKPGCFTKLLPDVAFSPSIGIVELLDAWVLFLPNAPIIIDARGRIVEELSSEYARLVYSYDFDVAQALREAERIDGSTFVIIDDVWSENYCHWIADWLTRLAILENMQGAKSCRVISSPITTAFQRYTLARAGVLDRVVPARECRAFRAKRLLVPTNLGSGLRHPAQKAAPWAISYLREKIQRPRAGEAAPEPRPRKVYISRKDATGRRVLNEDDVEALLGRHGFVTVQLGAMDPAEQISLFGGADYIIGLHGAGLTNIVFAPEGARLLEIFPASYGTPAFWRLAAGSKVHYACVVESMVAAEARPQIDDIYIDLAVLEEAVQIFMP